MTLIEIPRICWDLQTMLIYKLVHVQITFSNNVEKIYLIYLNFFIFQNNFSYSCVIHTNVYMCMYFHYFGNNFLKKSLLSKDLWDEFYRIMVTARYIYIFIWYSYWHYNKNAIKYWLLQASIYFLEMSVSWYALLWEHSFVKMKAYNIFPNILAKFNHCLLLENMIPIKNTTDLEHNMLWLSTAVL